jgi:crotonobetainyl-CoA:carnitine CoA-transferase CaiB-like acyl-CoA transferase
VQSGGLVDVRLTDGERRGHQAALPALPLQFDRDRAGNSLGLPVIGEHSSEVLAELGIVDEDIRDLLARHIVDVGARDQEDSP